MWFHIFNITCGETLIKIDLFFSIWFSFLLVSFKFLIILGRVKIRFSIFVFLTKKSGPWRSREGNSNPLQYSCLKNPMDRGAWWTIIQRITVSQLRDKSQHSTEISRGKIMNLGSNVLSLKYNHMELSRRLSAWRRHECEKNRFVDKVVLEARREDELFPGKVENKERKIES